MSTYLDCHRVHSKRKLFSSFTLRPPTRLNTLHARAVLTLIFLDMVREHVLRCSGRRRTN